MPSTVCHGRCTKESGFLTFSRHNGYKNGFKFCSNCNKWIKTDSFKCICCNSRLRSSPRGRTN
jgi:hypothetical protein